MKRLSAILILILIYSCTSDPIPEKIEKQEPKLVETFIKTFEGSIDGAYDIVMKITSNAGAITGKYFYTSVGENLVLKGSLDTAGIILFEEYTTEGNRVGKFEGALMDDKLTGEWTKGGEIKSLSFELAESDEDYTLLQNETKNRIDSEKNLVKTGRYYSRKTSNMHYGYIEITRINETVCDFKMNVGGSGCDGSISGRLRLNEKGTAAFSKEGCRMVVFEFRFGAISVHENVPCADHGEGCDFNGTYEIGD
ncbi:MAG: hypothetical protein ACI865_000941 [Flavobacteriaceae bacterium]|jgi:hypothetical protein